MEATGGGIDARYGSRPDRKFYDRVVAQGSPDPTRIMRAAERRWERNVQRVVDPQNGFDDRALASFIRRLLPSGLSEIHRHNFEAIGYVLKGTGYEIHDGVRIDWVEGDALFVPPNVWHQHANSSDNDEAIILLTTNAPMLLELGVCTMEPAPTWEEALQRPSPYMRPVLGTDTVRDAGTG